MAVFEQSALARAPQDVAVPLFASRGCERREKPYRRGEGAPAREMEAESA
jgi:hypothetical protein